MCQPGGASAAGAGLSGIRRAGQHPADEKIFERHTVIAGMLMSLGVDPETAAEDACRIEHAISDASFEAIKGHMEQMQKRRA